MKNNCLRIALHCGVTLFSKLGGKGERVCGVEIAGYYGIRSVQ